MCTEGLTFIVFFRIRRFMYFLWSPDSYNSEKFLFTFVFRKLTRLRLVFFLCGGSLCFKLKYLYPPSPGRMENFGKIYKQRQKSGAASYILDFEDICCFRCHGKELSYLSKYKRGSYTSSDKIILISY